MRTPNLDLEAEIGNDRGLETKRFTATGTLGRPFGSRRAEVLENDFVLLLFRVHLEKRASRLREKDDTVLVTEGRIITNRNGGGKELSPPWAAFEVAGLTVPNWENAD